MNKSKILVPLGKKSYEVTIEAGIRNKINEELLKIGVKNNRKILVISNKEKRIMKKLKPLPKGKKSKGLRKLPKQVRNKMGFMKKGGKVK